MMKSSRLSLLVFVQYAMGRSLGTRLCLHYTKGTIKAAEIGLIGRN